MPRTTGIDHIAIYVSHLEEAKRFFLEGLGMTVHSDYGDEFFMKAGEQIFALFAGDCAHQSVNHIALNIDDLDAMKSHLEALGYPIYKGDMVDGPDGIRIQLVL